MSQLEKFVAVCRDLIYSQGSWLCEFDVEWIKAGTHARFQLQGKTSKALIDWSEGDSFRMHILSADTVYYETSRRVETADQAVQRVSSLLWDCPR